MTVGLLTLALVAGCALGAAIGLRRGRRPAPDRPADSGEAPPPAEQTAVGEIDRALHKAVDHLDIGVVVSDEAGSVVYRNRSADAMLVTHVGLLVDANVERLLGLARDGEASDAVVELHGPPALAVEITAAPVAGGAAVATISDVSDRVRIDAMRTDFVANVSHELRTPVGAVAVLAETLLAGADDVDLVTSVAARTVEESHRAVRTLDDLLELSSIEAAGPATDVVDLADVLHAAVARGRVADPDDRVDIELFPPVRALRVRGDEKQLSSALGNLVENAVKYSPNGGAVQLRAYTDERNVELTVADQGIGIPQRDLDRIFERFYRVDKGRGRGTGGTGLGLAIVRHVAGNHGGEVQVSSREGQGSTFVLRLPARLVVDDIDSRGEVAEGLRGWVHHE